MMDKFVESVKQIALNAVSAAKPVELCFGTVVEISPFSVRLDQKLILTKVTAFIFQAIPGVFLRFVLRDTKTACPESKSR